MILGMSFRESPNSQPNIFMLDTRMTPSPERVPAHQLRRFCRRQHKHDRQPLRTTTINHRPRLRPRRLPSRPAEPDERTCFGPHVLHSAQGRKKRVSEGEDPDHHRVISRARTPRRARTPLLP